jgi:sialic acid synthase SpsE
MEPEVLLTYLQESDNRPQLGLGEQNSHPSAARSAERSIEFGKQLDDEELHTLRSERNSITILTQRIRTVSEHVARMDVTANAYRISM